MIRPSSAKQIDALVEDLASADPLRRNAAVARLTVIGTRAVQRLSVVAASHGQASARTAAFRALDAIDDPRTLDAALGSVRDRDPAVASAAIAVARKFLRGARGTIAIDRLTAAALDRTLDEPIRIAALRALRDLDDRTIAPLLKTLCEDRSPALRAAAEPSRSTRDRRRSASPIETLEDAASGPLPDDAGGLVAAMAAAAGDVPLTTLLRIVERVREREAAEPAASRAEWTAVRAAAHAALANRRSTLAVYDLRESIAAAPRPLPPPFVTAVALVGDVSCLESIAIAYARARDAAWRAALRDAFGSIVKREKITRRSSVMKKIEKRWAGLTRELST